MCGIVCMISICVLIGRRPNDDKKRPTDEYSLAVSATGLTDAGFPAEAIELLDKAIARDRTNRTAYNARGVAHYKMHRFDKALKDFNTAVSLDGNHPEAYFNRTACLVILGKFENALKDIDRFVSLNSAPPEKIAVALRRRAALKTTAGDLTGAIEDLDKAISKAPQNSGIFKEAHTARAILLKAMRMAERHP